MSAKRLSLLAAATVCGVLAPNKSCWAQAYGANAVVEHHDLRWFEPVELDIDGQMPRRDAGFFFSADKVGWWTVNNKVEIGHAGLVVDSERVQPAPTVDIALTSLEQIETFDFINSAQEALSFAGLRFAVVDDNGTPNVFRDDTESILGFNSLNRAFTRGITGVLPLTTVDDLTAGLIRISNGYTDAGSDGVLGTADDIVVGPNNVRVGDEPTPYGVRNSIRDALPDAGFAWGERYEFGYSDGEQGWMLTVLDGPEAQSGGVYGAGEGAMYFSQSGTDTFGPDPYFLGDLEDDDGDGIGDGDGEQGAADIWAFGFGSVAVNFNLPNEDFLKGFRDYNNSDTPFTTSGPIMYVGNVGGAFNDIDVVGLGTGSAGGGTGGNQVPVATAAIQNVIDQLAGASPSATIIDQNYTSLVQELTVLDAINADAGVAVVIGQLATVLNLQVDATTGNLTGAFGSAPPPLFTGNADLTDPTIVNQATVQADQARTLINTLNDLLVATGTGTGGTGQAVTTTEEQRQADDLNGNGAPGFTRVVASVGGVNQVIGTIFDFGDLHTFNVFFDEVTVRNRTEIDGVELMRMHELSTRHHLQQGRWDSLRLTYGARFLSVKDNFYMQGIGSILGRTTVSTDVENQIIGPQVGLKWTRRDGPWNFIVEARGTAGYNIVDIDQSGIFGEEAIPGALNRSSTARTTTSVDGFRFDEFSPLGELRVQLQYRLAEAISLQAGYTAKYVGNIHRGGDSTAWNAPDFGVHDYKGDLFTNGLNLGVELRH